VARRLTQVRIPERAAALAVFLAVALLPVVLRFNPYYLSILVSALVLGAVSIAWNVLGGLCGQVSFGHAGFFGVGAYASAVLAMKGDLSPLLAMPAAGLVGVAAALAIGLPAFKLRGPYFALAILGFAEVLKLVALNLDPVTGGSQGIFGVPPPPPLRLGGLTIEFAVSRTSNYYFAALLLLAVYLSAALLRGSRAGVAMATVRADEEAAAGIGVPVRRTKVLALSVSAFFTAFLGAFYAHYVHYLAPDSAFDASWSILPIVASLFGGMATLVGPAVGALAITGLDEFLFKRLFETGHQLFFGLLLATVIVWAPSGLLGGRIGGRRSPPRPAHAPERRSAA
jgi:branched-chain amino acid transport system permease protein